MTQEQIIEKIAETAGVNAENVSLENNLKTDLNIDSIDLVELLMILEEELGSEIPEEDAIKFETIQDVVSYIQNK